MLLSVAPLNAINVTISIIDKTIIPTGKSILTNTFNETNQALEKFENPIVKKSKVFTSSSLFNFMKEISNP